MDQINQIAMHWSTWIVPVTIQVTILIAFLGVLDVLIRKWAWPQLRYALWLLVLVKLILPPSFAAPTSLTSDLAPANYGVHAAADAVNGDAATVVSASSADADYSEVSTVPAVPILTPVAEVPAISATPVIPDLIRDPVLRTQAALPGNVLPDAKLSLRSIEKVLAPLVIEAEPLSLAAYLMVAWLLGLVLLGAWLFLRLRRLARRHAEETANSSLPAWFDELLAEQAEKLKLRRRPRVVLSPHVNAPAVFGLFRPLLLIPQQGFHQTSRRDTEHILLHELSHIKRADLIVHAVFMLLQVVYWFNPLLWLLRRHLQHLRELCCDATVARVLGEETPAYRQTLLETARRLLAKPTEPGLGLLGLFENSNRLITRLNWLQKKTWEHPRLRRATITVVTILMLACVLPMAKAQKEADSTDNLGGTSPDPTPSGPRWIESDESSVIGEHVVKSGWFDDSVWVPSAENLDVVFSTPLEQVRRQLTLIEHVASAAKPQIQYEMRILHFPADPVIDRDRQDDNRLNVSFGSAEAERLLELTRANKDGRSLVAPHMTLLDGQEASISLDRITGHGLRIKVIGHVQPDNKAVKTVVDLVRNESQLRTHKDDYGSHVSVSTGDVMSATAIINDGESIVIGPVPDSGKSLYFTMTATILPVDQERLAAIKKRLFRDSGEDAALAQAQQELRLAKAINKEYQKHIEEELEKRKEAVESAEPAEPIPTTAPAEDMSPDHRWRQTLILDQLRTLQPEKLRLEISLQKMGHLAQQLSDGGLSPQAQEILESDPQVHSLTAQALSLAEQGERLRDRLGAEHTQVREIERILESSNELLAARKAELTRLYAQTETTEVNTYINQQELELRDVSDTIAALSTQLARLDKLWIEHKRITGETEVSSRRLAHLNDELSDLSVRANNPDRVPIEIVARAGVALPITDGDPGKYMSRALVRCTRSVQLGAVTPLTAEMLDLEANNHALYLSHESFQIKVLARLNVQQTKWFQHLPDSPARLLALRKSFSVSPEFGTAFIQLRMTAASAAEAQAILNEILDQFMQDMDAKANSTLRNRGAALRKERDSVEQELARRQQDLIILRHQLSQ